MFDVQVRQRVRVLQEYNIKTGMCLSIININTGIILTSTLTVLTIRLQVQSSNRLELY